MDSYHKQAIKYQISLMAHIMGFKSAQSHIRAEFEAVVRCKLEEPTEYAKMLEFTGSEEILGETMEFLKKEFFPLTEDQFENWLQQE